MNDVRNAHVCRLCMYQFKNNHQKLIGLNCSKTCIIVWQVLCFYKMSAFVSSKGGPTREKLTSVRNQPKPRPACASLQFDKGLFVCCILSRRSRYCIGEELMS